MRTNCIDSLDRTNFAQEIFGYTAVLRQLNCLGVLKYPEIQIKSQFFNHIFDIYNKMGDVISIQYGGSTAHHGSITKKKKGLASLGDVLTSIKRHYNNVVTDPGRQRIYNLLLGIFNPMNSSLPIWKL